MYEFLLTFQFKWTEISPLSSKSLSKFTKMKNCFAIPSGGKSFAFIDSLFDMSVKNLNFIKIKKNIVSEEI